MFLKTLFSKSCIIISVMIGDNGDLIGVLGLFINNNIEKSERVESESRK